MDERDDPTPPPLSYSDGRTVGDVERRAVRTMRWVVIALWLSPVIVFMGCGVVWTLWRLLK